MDAPRISDGLLVSAAQVATAELVAALTPGARSPLTGLGKMSIDTTPGPVVDATVALVEHHDKSLLRATLAAQLLAVGPLAERAAGIRAAGLAAAGASAVTGTLSAVRPETETLPSLLAGLAGSFAALRSARALAEQPASRGLRTALAAGLGTAAAAAARAAVRRDLDHAETLASIELPAPADPAPWDAAEAALSVPGISPLFTEAGDFYVTDTQLPAPAIDPADWKLTVGGMVDEPFELSYEELLAEPLVEMDSTLVCVHNPVGGPRLGSARWLGIPLADLLDRAGVRPGSDQLLVRAVDGFSAGLPLDLARDPERGAMLVVGMNGTALPRDHGFPARLITPGLWGQDGNTKWVSSLELTTWQAVADYWDTRGWPRRPVAVRAGSRIDVPGNRELLNAGELAVVAGVAWAPPDGVEAVEVQIDRGSWERAELSPEVSPRMWRQWRLPWVPEPGTHHIRVRSIGRSRQQAEHYEPPYPTGSSGLQEITVEAGLASRTPGELRRARLLAAADDLADRAHLAQTGLRAWRARGFPPPPRFPAPNSRRLGDPAA